MNAYRMDPTRGAAGAAVVLAILMTASAASTGSDGGLQPAASPQPRADSSSGGAAAEEIPLAVQIFFKPLPTEMPGSRDDTPEIIAVGRKLFFEQGISLTKSQSCSECHHLDARRAGGDGEPTSKGAKGLLGKRNAPTVLNAGFQVAQFWDGRAADLVEQAKGPVLNPDEMAMRSPEEVVDRLKSIDGYVPAFKAAYPDQAEPVTFDNMARAIAAFERTLVTPSRFDRYLRGETSALTQQEKQGLNCFTHTGCVECHSSYTVGGRLFEKVGVYHPYTNQEDVGRYGVTHNDEDRLVFKVPMLRNITLTAPYFHDGREAALTEAVRLMAWMQLDTKLSAAEIEEIVSFLHALEAEHPVNIAGP
ncbi:MAG TPA: cytochrome c peroxidase [Phycisphaerae bacterium]|nr:cytochrome c peroxidase [Phycisphaerae bacterium]